MGWSRSHFGRTNALRHGDGRQPYISGILFLIYISEWRSVHLSLNLYQSEAAKFQKHGELILPNFRQICAKRTKFLLHIVQFPHKINDKITGWQILLFPIRIFATTKGIQHFFCFILTHLPVDQSFCTYSDRWSRAISNTNKQSQLVHHHLC